MPHIVAAHQLYTFHVATLLRHIAPLATYPIVLTWYIPYTRGGIRGQEGYTELQENILKKIWLKVNTDPVNISGH